MIIHCYDRSSWESALALPLDAELHALLAARLRYLESEGIADMTDVVIVTADTTDAELINAIGWTWRFDPNGCRAGQPGYAMPFDLAYKASASFHVAVQIVGNAGAAVEMAIHDDADPALLALVRAVAE